jgi:fatty acid desaturase
MLRPTSEPATFSISQARGIVRDLFTPNPLIYWGDFLGSFIVGTICYALVRRVEPLSVQQACVFFVSGVLYYRAALFIHETTHLRAGTFRSFRVIWNLLVGIPFLIPSFMYYSHVDHHMRKHFGTDDDGEYLALATTGPWQILLYLCQPLLLAPFAVVRFLILAPLGWLSPSFRRFLHQRASSLVMDPSYVRPLPSRNSLRIFRLQEIACFLVCWGGAILLIRGRLPLGFLIQAYATSVFVLYLNHLRTLGAHRYTNVGGEMTFVDQLLDSVNYPNSRVLSAIWAPVGLRFHALHHLFPSLPYHALDQAHRRLMAELPADSPYRLTNSPSLWNSICRLWRVSRAAQLEGRARGNSADDLQPAMRGFSRQTS